MDRSIDKAAKSAVITAAKDTKFKVSYTEIDPYFIAAMAKRMNSFKVENGGKYEKFNFENYMNNTSLLEIVDAAERHLADLKLLLRDRPPIHNPEETISHHTSAIGVNMMIIDYHTR